MKVKNWTDWEEYWYSPTLENHGTYFTITNENKRGLFVSSFNGSGPFRKNEKSNPIGFKYKNKS